MKIGFKFFHILAAFLFLSSLAFAQKTTIQQPTVAKSTGTPSATNFSSSPGHVVDGIEHQFNLLDQVQPTGNIISEGYDIYEAMSIAHLLEFPYKDAAGVGQIYLSSVGPTPVATQRMDDRNQLKAGQFLDVIGTINALDSAAGLENYVTTSLHGTIPLNTIMTITTIHTDHLYSAVNSNGVSYPLTPTFYFNTEVKIKRTSTGWVIAEVIDES